LSLQLGDVTGFNDLPEHSPQPGGHTNPRLSRKSPPLMERGTEAPGPLQFSGQMGGHCKYFD